MAAVLIVLDEAVFSSRMPAVAGAAAPAAKAPLWQDRLAVLYGGLTFGYPYWKRGLESAILAHLTADVALVTGVRLLAS